jgi:hypothetical protein
MDKPLFQVGSKVIIVHDEPSKVRRVTEVDAHIYAGRTFAIYKVKPGRGWIMEGDLENANA